MLFASLLALTLSLSSAIAESPLGSATTPDDVIFWKDGQNSLTIDALPDGTKKISWAEAPNADYYYLIICQKGFILDNPDESVKSSTWNIMIWEQFNGIADPTQKALAVISEYDASLWCRSDINEYTFEPSEALTTIVYAQNGISYETVEGKVVPSPEGPQLESIVENVFVFYVEKEILPTPSPIPSATQSPATAATAATASASPSPATSEEPAPYTGVAKDIEIIGFVEITGSGKVNLRAGDTTDSPVIERVEPGNTYVCIDITPRGWYVIYNADLEIVCVAPSVVTFTSIDKK